MLERKRIYTLVIHKYYNKGPFSYHTYKRQFSSLEYAMTYGFKKILDKYLKARGIDDFSKFTDSENRSYIECLNNYKCVLPYRDESSTIEMYIEKGEVIDDEYIGDILGEIFK